MTDAQFNILIAVIGAGLTAIGMAIRFTGGRLIKALDTNTATMLDNTKSNAVLSTKIDSIADYVQKRSGDTPVQGVPIVNPQGGYSHHMKKGG